MCPSWNLFLGAQRPDEHVVIDSALTVERRALVRSARAELIALLDTTARLLPGDRFIAGQRVRFLVDQGETDRALNAARACRDPEWWCGALVGFVLQRRDDIVGAESAFARARATMPPDVRCSWSDVGALLDSTARSEYRGIGCATRDTLDAKLWWLGDPLWVDPGNERRVEQDARRVSPILRSALPKDERFNGRSRSWRSTRVQCSAATLQFSSRSQLNWSRSVTLSQSTRTPCS